VGNRITCCVVEGSNHSKMSPLPHRQRPHLQTDDHDDVLKEKQQALDLSVLMLNQQSSKQPAFSPSKPQRGDVVVGRINTKAKSRFDSSSLMLIHRIPNTNETANAYVVSTTSKGCFVRLSRLVEGRVILKELSDEFIPNPSTVFPPGRLIVGKVKNIKESHKKTKKGIAPITFVDMDLRESVLLASGDRVTMDDVQENLKYTGVITRVESYGVFVRIDNSDISGLAMYVILHRYIKGFTEIINFNNNLYKTNFTSNNKSPPSTTSLADPSILLIHRHSLYFYYVYDHPVFSYVHQHYHYPSSYWLPHGNSNIHFHNGIHLGNSIYKFWFD